MDSIPQVIENLSLKKPNTQRNIHEAWKIVAREHAGHSAVKDFQKGMLRVHVDSSARMFQLSTFKAELIKNLKNEMPDLVDIAFKVGKIK
jgi:hypothetical protein